MPRPLPIDLVVGDCVGLRTVVAGPELRAYGNRGCKRTQVLLRCGCGRERWVNPGEADRNGCDCQRDIVHGHARKKTRHPLYTVWASMKQRCSNPRNPEYRNYGARGITVCDEWLDAANFLVWAGSAGWEPGLQIDRIDNDGDYEPGNCRFVTPKVNSNNKRFSGPPPRGGR